MIQTGFTSEYSSVHIPQIRVDGVYRKITKVGTIVVRELVIEKLRETQSFKHKLQVIPALYDTSYTNSVKDLQPFIVPCAFLMISLITTGVAVLHPKRVLAPVLLIHQQQKKSHPV